MTSISKECLAVWKKEAEAFLASPPDYIVLPIGVKPKIVTSVEKKGLTKDAPSQCMRLYQAGDQQWVVKLQGEAKNFPRITSGLPKSKSRVRAAPVEEDDDPNYDEEEASISKKRKTKKGASTTKEVVTPVPARRTAALPSAPNAPKKRSASSRSAQPEEEEMSELGRGKRRSTRKDSAAAEANEDVFHSVKAEEQSVDDLASLCGRVDGLEVMSSIDLESDSEEAGGRRTPVASTSRLTARALGAYGSH